MYPKTNENGLQDWASIDSQLSKIVDFIESEMKLKQEMIVHQLSQVQEMNAAIANKDDQISELHEKLRKCHQNAEGLHQLMNKLLNDIENYQKDIDWYRRTYEKRSLFGILKDKFFRPSNPEGQRP